MSEDSNVANFYRTWNQHLAALRDMSTKVAQDMAASDDETQQMGTAAYEEFRQLVLGVDRSLPIPGKVTKGLP
jgi:hypothetical protein